jgi:streptogramin lyase
VRKTGLIAGILVALGMGAAPAAAKPGDLVVAEYNASAVSRVTLSGAVSAISSGSPLVSPNFLTFEPNGKLVAADENFPGAFRIDPGTGTATELNNDIDIGGIDRSPSGDFIASDQGADAIVKVNRKSGAASVVTSGGLLDNLYGLDVGPNGDIFAINATGSVVRVTQAGAQSEVAADSSLVGIEDITRAPDGTLFVVNTDDGTVLRIDPRTGVISPVGSGVGNSFSLAVAPSGLIYTTDYGAGTISSVDPSTGDVDLVASEELDGPLGIEVAPPKCNGKLATIVGSTKKDKLKGSKFAAVIAGLKGKDRIKGGKAKDRICAGKSKDKLKTADRKRDKVNCGGGKDKATVDEKDKVARNCETVVVK